MYFSATTTRLKSVTTQPLQTVKGMSNVQLRQQQSGSSLYLHSHFKLSKGCQMYNLDNNSQAQVCIYTATSNCPRDVKCTTQTTAIRLSLYLHSHFKLSKGCQMYNSDNNNQAQVSIYTTSSNCSQDFRCAIQTTTIRLSLYLHSHFKLS